GHSRFPVMDEDREKIVGILLAKDLLRLQLASEDSPFDIKEFMRPAAFVPESKRLNVLLREMRRSRVHMAVVADEYGGIAGLVTIEDVLEQIVGEIEDEFDIAEDEGDIFGLTDHTYRVSGDTSIERVNEAFGVLLPETDFETIGGLVAHEMGHVPKRGEHYALAGLQFTVLHTKGGAVRWFKVSPVAAST
ncbi:MAG: CBS domain-containing protein, partial [Polaromonas sp.]|nr:CBS domain-containing protein [Polaromonas sp.]